ncbi:MAG: histidine phosphatase family protein [Synergistaceae bacterium]|nr:histidine phosphatase family protein [Synergistaceae bacterium]
MNNRIYLVRHGRPELPDRNTRFLGRSDLPLSEEGRGQAEELKKVFDDLPLEGVFTSGLKRADETASIIAGHRDIPFTTVPALQEIAFGKWELLTMDEIRRKDPDAYEARGRDFANFRPEGGENFLEVQQRAWPAFLSLVDGGEGDILVTAHSGVFKVLLLTLLELPWEKLFTLRQDYCGVHILERSGGEFLLEKLNWSPRLEG